MEKSMERMIAVCGISCTECGAFLATKSDDDMKRREVARVWTDRYKRAIKPEDINCDGCRSVGGVLFSYCNVCDIRTCGQEKGVENCAYCDRYACEKLENFFQMVPDAKKMLDGIRSKI